MRGSEIIRRLHEHRTWVNQNLRAAALTLGHEQLHRSLTIGQGSIWKSLLHMYAAEYVWLECLRGHEQAVLRGDLPNKLPGNQEGEGGVASIADLNDGWRQLDGHWNDYLQSLNDEDLEQAVAKVGSNGVRTTTRRADVLLHVCTHAHYTAAQVLNMLRQVGSTPLPEVMMIALARQQAATT